MRKLATATCLALGLMAIPGIASAAPIGINACTLDDTGLGMCDIFADYTGTGASSLGSAEGNLGSYLLGYTILLNQNADLSDGFDAADVAHILVIHDNLFELFSNTVFNDLFDSVFAAAISGADIDGSSPSIGQLAGCPAVPGGVPNLNGVGYCTNADLVSLLVNWGEPGVGGQDVVSIHTALPLVEEPPPTPVPEPGTLTLFALGASGAFASLRRRRTARQPSL